METQQFLDYLNEHTVTRDIAAEVAELLAVRRRRGLVAARTAPIERQSAELIAS